MCPLFRISETAGPDYAVIWFMVTDPLAWHFTEVNGGVTGACAHVSTPFPYLGNGWTDCAETLCVIRGSLAMCLTHNGGGGGIRTSASVTLHTFTSLVFLGAIYPNSASKIQ